MAATDVEWCMSVAGGGSVTFGAPMVLYSQHPAEMYKQLQDLQNAAHGRKRTHRLQCHNYVNNADAVPRSLGSSLSALHHAVEDYVPAMSVSKALMTASACATSYILGFVSANHASALKVRFCFGLSSFCHLY